MRDEKARRLVAGQAKCYTSPPTRLVHVTSRQPLEEGFEGVAAILFLLVIVFGIGTIFSGLFTVATAEAAVVQRFGKFVRVAGPGLNFKLPWIERVVAKEDLRVQQLAGHARLRTHRRAAKACRDAT